VRFRDLVARHDVACDVEARSAGFIKPGRGSPDRALEVSQERGIDLTRHVSRVLEECSVDADTLVVVMEPGQVRGVREAYGAATRVLVLGDLDPVLPSRRLIPDPWGHPSEVFRASFDRIDRCLGELLPYVCRSADGPPHGRAQR
jgi:protein-tyrosine-phosphatase